MQRAVLVQVVVPILATVAIVVIVKLIMKLFCGILKPLTLYTLLHVASWLPQKTISSKFVRTYKVLKKNNFS